MVKDYLENKQFEIIHLFWNKGPHFPALFINSVYTIGGGGYYKQAFVTPHLEVYNCIKEHENVFLHKEKKCRFSNVVKYIAGHCRWIILHDIGPQREVICIPNSILKRTIWRTWGGNKIRTKQGVGDTFLSNIVHNGLSKMACWKLKMLYCIGVENLIDQIELEEIIGHANYRRLTYFTGNKTYPVIIKGGRKDRLNILVGHSCFPEDHHIKILNYIERFKKYINVFIVTSYGESDYTEYVREKSVDIFGDHVFFIDKFLPAEEYTKFLSSIDIAILDFEYSYALGNLSVLLYFCKTLYLNQNGYIKKAFDRLCIPHHITEELNKCSYDSFSSLLDYDNSSCTELINACDDLPYKCWNNLFSDLVKE